MFRLNFMARPRKIKVEVGELEGKGIVISTGAEEITTPEVEMYNGKEVIAKGEVEINGVIRKTITTKEGSTYTL